MKKRTREDDANQNSPDLKSWRTPINKSPETGGK